MQKKTATLRRPLSGFSLCLFKVRGAENKTLARQIDLFILNFDLERLPEVTFTPVGVITSLSNAMDEQKKSFILMSSSSTEKIAGVKMPHFDIRDAKISQLRIYIFREKEKTNKTTMRIFLFFAIFFKFASCFYKDKVYCERYYKVEVDTIYATEFDTKCVVHYRKKCHVEFDRAYDTKYERRCETRYAPKCERLPAKTFVDRCDFHHEVKCETHYDVVYDTKCVEGKDKVCDVEQQLAHVTEFERVCDHEHEHEECRHVPRHVKRPVPKTSCREVPKRRCHQTPRKVPRHECRKVPLKKCRKVPKDTYKEHCIQIPHEKCLEFPVRVPRNVPRRECHTEPVERCKKLPRKVPRPVAHKVPKLKCKKKKTFSFYPFY